MKAPCYDLGLMDYPSCWTLQQSLFDSLISHKSAKAGAKTSNAPLVIAEATDTEGQSQKIVLSDNSEEAGCVLFVEHLPVYTLGKSGHSENLLIARNTLEAMGAQFFHIDRGGDITFHGPGQLVGYPILDLEKVGIGLREYIDALEEAVIRTVDHFGIRGGRIAGASGVWIDIESPRPRKICAIGVRSSRYVTMHGFALNVTTDLNWFARINPCGFTDRGVTSIALETGTTPSMEEVKDLVMNFLSEILNVKIYKNKIVCP
ncbi:MAG: lipoyl(octanoyl) transferase LipB [Rikenellaceae bacterium]|nr:lipoyl(octanoyl) transferase LipB [Rikenellaceae bacterium]